ncbi:hypothetical protein [Thermoactinospora rubra]|uniref:hypothetical protein n=1 Tax=Thermoactinospora rubra TaxID=1088767 RepID=UPI000A0F5502|nr:hypothetical protein [Thermoactinospora rubra]
MGHPQQPPSEPYGHYQPQPQVPAPYGQPYLPASGPHYGPVQTVTVKERGFNPVTFGVHACLWIFLHSWLTFLTIGFWLLVAIPVTFIGWRVTRTVPVQQIQQPPYPPQYGQPGY